MIHWAIEWAQVRKMETPSWGAVTKGFLGPERRTGLVR